MKELIVDRIRLAQPAVPQMNVQSYREFERCPRCRKTWETFAVYECPACGTVFCSACEVEEEVPPGQRWVAAAHAETNVERCPVCTAPIADSDQVGTIAGRRL